MLEASDDLEVEKEDHVAFPFDVFVLEERPGISEEED